MSAPPPPGGLVGAGAMRRRMRRRLAGEDERRLQSALRGGCVSRRVDIGDGEVGRAAAPADIEKVFDKPGSQWDVVVVEGGVPEGGAAGPPQRAVAEWGLATTRISMGLRSSIEDERLNALKACCLNAALARHPDVLPLVLRNALDPSPEMRQLAMRAHKLFYRERNSVLDWLYAPTQYAKLLAIARWKVGPGREQDAWQEFAYRSYEDGEQTKFYFYSLPTVIASYDPRAPGSKRFWPYLLSCFSRYCVRSRKRFVGLELLLAR